MRVATREITIEQDVRVYIVQQLGLSTMRPRRCHDHGLRWCHLADRLAARYQFDATEFRYLDDPEYFADYIPYLIRQRRWTAFCRRAKHRGALLVAALTVNVLLSLIFSDPVPVFVRLIWVAGVVLVITILNHMRNELSGFE